MDEYIENNEKEDDATDSSTDEDLRDLFMKKKGTYI